MKSNDMNKLRWAGKTPEERAEFARLGAEAAAASMTPEQRSARAKKASIAAAAKRSAAKQARLKAAAKKSSRKK